MLQIEQAIKFNPLYFGLEILIFIILVKVMDRLFWSPFMRDMEDRAKDLEARYRRREELQIEMERLRADYQQRIAQVDAEARAHIQEAVKHAQAERERILREARAQAEQLLVQGREAIQREREETLLALTKEMVGMATEVADHALGSLTPKAELQSAIEAYVAAATASVQGG